MECNRNVKNVIYIFEVIDETSIYGVKNVNFIFHVETAAMRDEMVNAVKRHLFFHPRIFFGPMGLGETLPIFLRFSLLGKGGQKCKICS